VQLLGWETHACAASLHLRAPAEADTALGASSVDVLDHDGVTTDHLYHLAHKGVTQLCLAGGLQ
jgi:hypothetical protein